MAAAAEARSFVTHSFIADCETPVSAFLKLRGDGPAFLLESAEQGQRVGRWSFIGFAPREVLRWSLGDPGDPYALAAAAVERHRVDPAADLPPFAGGAVGFFGYDLVRTVEPLGRPQPRRPRAAGHGAHAVGHARRLRSPQAHDHRARGRRRGGGRGPPRRSPARCRRPRAHPPSPRPPHSRRTWSAASSRRWSRGSSSTATRATPSRSSRRSAGARRWSATRSRSTAGCARSTRRPTCTSWTFGDFEVVGASPEPLLTVTEDRPRLDPSDRRHPTARRRPRRPTSASRASCWPTRRSAPSTSCSSTSDATTSGASASSARWRSTASWPSRPTRTSCTSVSNVSGVLRDDVGPMDALRSGAARGDAQRRAQGPGDADHRRARARQARRLRRGDRLPELHGRAGHLHPHPHRRLQGRHGATSRRGAGPSPTPGRSTSTRSP